MPEITVPCPNCQTSLLVDEQIAGHEVLCPECQTRVTLPRDLSAAAVPLMKGAPAADETPVRKNHPLHRTGHLTALPAEPDPAAGPPPPRASHLPERRGLTPEEEMRRLAALTAEPAAYDLHNVDTKGRTAFPCPGCHRPVWIARTEWGLTVNCEGCAREVVAPDPSSGEPARLVQPDAAPEPRQKTVLPGRRQVEDLGVGELPAAGRPKRQRGQLPPTREPAPDPMMQAADRARTRAPHIEPIPARGDVDMAAPVRKGPPAGKRVVTPTQEQAAAAAAFEDHDTAQGIVPVELPQVKMHHRIHPERAPNFTPKHEADLSVETTGNWGGESAQENSLAFRRTLTVAILTLLLGAIAVTAFLLRSTWARPDLSSNNAEPESPVQGVDMAKATIDRFFSAVTVEDRAKEVRHPEITLPRMKSWYARNSRARHEVEYTTDWREQDNYAGKGVNFIFTSVVLDALNNYEVSLEIPKDGGPPKIDWEHFIGWSETPWIEFLKSTSIQPGEFRVTVTPIDYYNGHFSDRSRYLAFTVKDRDNSGFCTAYCEANTNLGNMLLKSIRLARNLNMIDGVSQDGLARVILRLRYLPEGQPLNQATIDALVWDDWLEP